MAAGLRGEGRENLEEGAAVILQKKVGNAELAATRPAVKAAGRHATSPLTL
jgi:hypothetical protein